MSVKIESNIICIVKEEHIHKDLFKENTSILYVRLDVSNPIKVFLKMLLKT
jgi:hypothetical protein